MLMDIYVISADVSRWTDDVKQADFYLSVTYYQANCSPGVNHLLGIQFRGKSVCSWCDGLSD